MISKLYIENFRSILKADLDLGRFTLLTGANNSGKTSFIYALLALKNVVTNPNQTIDSFFNFPFINLGGFTQTVFKKKDDANIIFRILYGNDFDAFTVSLGKQESFWEIDTYLAKELKLSVNFPYPGNKAVSTEFIVDDNGQVSFTWYGSSANVSITKPSEQASETANSLQRQLVAFVGELAAVDGVSIRRLFSKQAFGVVPLSPQIWSEDEIATLLSTDRDLEGKVAHYLEKIVDRNFSVRFTPGTANFFLQTRDKSTAFVSDLVNEGLGTNQLVTLLAKTLNKNTRLICIDEPEIHLHPTIINRLVDTLIEIADLEDKQFMVSTHSEHFVNALLRNVASENLKPDDLKAYYLTKDRKGVTQLEVQPVNAKGQMQGGLKNFYEAELENLKDLFDLSAE